MEKELINITHHERNTSTYCELYFAELCNQNIQKKPTRLVKQQKEDNENNWMSPSDIMVGKVDLYAPFTSRIFRGITHEGVISIGQGVLDKERIAFLKHLNQMIADSNAAWKHILEQELKPIPRKVKTFYDEIFFHKSKVTQDEIEVFYKESLHEFELHLRQEMKNVVIDVYANLVKDMDQEIKQKLKREKNKLESSLIKRNHRELQKTRTYYNILLYKQRVAYEIEIRSEIVNLKDALNAYYRLTEAETIISTMFVLSTEHKRCKIKQFLLNSYQTTEITEITNKLKKHQDMINALKPWDIPITKVNKEWEDRIKKILQLFLKFIRFCLGLLPDQSEFLLDFEKLVVLQFNEMIKSPGPMPFIGLLKEEEELLNVFKFEKKEHKRIICTCKEENRCICTKPFSIEGDITEVSKSSLGPEYDLPTMTVIKNGRKYVYAECLRYNEIREKLDIYQYRCRCREPSDEVVQPSDRKVETEEEPIVGTFSLESLLPPEAYKLLSKCPGRQCKDINQSFPEIGTFLDFTEENFSKVKLGLGKLRLDTPRPKAANEKEILSHALPFTETTEPHHTVSTQYSSQEDLYKPESTCVCADNTIPSRESLYRLSETSHDILDAVLLKRKQSLIKILEQSQNLRKIFTNDSFTFN